MNRSIPKLGTRDTSALSEKLLSGISHLALPVITTDEKVRVALPAKTITSIEKIAGVNLEEEFEKEIGRAHV